MIVCKADPGQVVQSQIRPFQLTTLKKKITELFEFLIRKFTVYSKVQKETRDESQVVLRLSALTKIEKIKLTQLPLLLTAAARVGYSPWPSLCFESSPWLQFNQLSSGEQNLLSVGAKIIAHARPGCLIAIDEPEISLNVAWQQHYTDLILKSLSHSPGSHVLIATHSPHFIASVPAGKSSVVLVERNQKNLSFKTMDSHFEGWGAEAILYQVLGIPSASSFLFERELAKVLRHIQDDGTDKNLIKNFITLASKLDFAGIEPLEDVVGEIKIYLEGLP